MHSAPGDAGSFLVRLSKGLKGHRCPEEWPQSLKAGDETKENANRCTERRTRLRCLQATEHLRTLLTVRLTYCRVKADEKTDHHLNPLKVLHCVDELMAEDSIIVADGGDFVGSAAYIMRPRGPMRWLDPGLLPAALSEHIGAFKVPLDFPEMRKLHPLLSLIPLLFAPLCDVTLLSLLP